MIEGINTKENKIGKLERNKRIQQLGAGPQFWFFLDRKIMGKLEDYDVEFVKRSEDVFGVFADEELGTTITSIFKNDLQNLIRSNLPQIRVLFGDNGTGKSTHLQYLDEILRQNYHDTYLFFELDLRHIVEKSEKGLWLNIFNQIFDAIQKRMDIIKILQDYDERVLRKIFKNTSIAKNVKNFGQDSSEDYFYGENFRNISNIQTFFNGIIDILMEKKVLTFIAIDEVQQIEKWGEPVFEAFLESFVASTYDKYMNSSQQARLFFVLSFLLKSPESHNDKYTFLERRSPGFVSRMKGKEIILCSFTESEHNLALKQIAEITDLSPEEEKQFESETKSKIEYWVKRSNPREFGKYIQEVFNKLGFLKLSPLEARLLYEKEARDWIKSQLIEDGFTYIAPESEKHLGFEFDVFAKTEERSIIKKCAFGEIKTTQRTKLKGEVEKFSFWLRSVRESTVYNHDNNYYFFISPFEPTPGCSEILTQYNIDWRTFSPPELLFSEELEMNDRPADTSQKPAAKPRRKPIKTPKKQKKQKITPLTPIKAISPQTLLKTIYKQIDKLGKTRVEALESKGVLSIQDLIDADLEELAKLVHGVSIKMLMNWKTECVKKINP